ncbi:hypothetical protein JQS43_18005 [Natronosporangium hydrolyticum]|uniref:Uncharacterized protein n=1 Tax=Natronosporangium hydrolyticum TaxID=2811111 RepID=A0A895YDL5_9ACTN|nr:hypothetical protein [Natronosporangium hydrolyticum]QSB13479.1 hypothetical protein JQS43_18005 [Natronosporangium hydrolyticum]
MTHDPYRQQPDPWQQPPQFPSSGPPGGQQPPEPPTVPVQYPQGGPPPGSAPPSGTPYGQPPESGPPGPFPPAGPASGGAFGPPPSGFGQGTPGSWPPPAAPTPPRRRTGLIIGLVAGGLTALLCLGGLGLLVVAAVLDDDSETVTAQSPEPQDPTGPTEEPTDPDADPFANSPAANFAVGDAGIELPAPRSVGDFSEEAVEQTLDLVQEALIAARIDPRMVEQRDPGGLIQLMSEDNRDLLEDDFAGGNFGYFATQIADGAVLAEPDPRVEGEVTFDATTDDDGIRVIEVVTAFVWAYAFEIPNDDPELDGIVVIRDEVVWQVPHDDDVRDSSAGLWLWSGEAYAWGIDCDAFDQSLIGPQTEQHFGVGGPGDDEIYDPEGSLEFADTC